MRHFLRLNHLLLIVFLLAACSGGGGGGSPPAPTFSAFSASLAQVQPGQATIVSWTVQGASSLSISPGVGPVDGLTSRSVSPTTTTTYVLTATNASGSATASTNAVIQPPPYPVGLASGTLDVGGVTREFRVYTPSGLAAAPKALVFVLHGGGGKGLNVANPGAHPLSAFRDVADREGFIVVYPGGLPASDGSPAWNDCRSDNRVASGADDLRFLDALIEQLRGQYGLPASRIFMSGGSNGAQMTLSYALAGAGNVAAIATSAGNLPLNPKAGDCSSSPSRPLPVLMVHGTADPAMPYAGGCVANVGGGCARGRVIGTEATRDAWLTTNGLSGVVPVQTVVDTNPSDPGPANRFLYSGAFPVEWWRMNGAGHTVASRTVLVPATSDTGAQNRDIEFAEIAWTFFKAQLPAF